MAFKRALWRSGLIYEQTCHQCKTTIRYMDNKLDFRPWYADGFIYCPKCRTPLRHNEAYAVVGADGNPLPTVTAASAPAPTPAPAPAPAAKKAFCPGCGNPFGETDRFCPQCGRKRDE